jgi:hypothetical protein
MKAADAKMGGAGPSTPMIFFAVTKINIIIGALF